MKKFFNAALLFLHDPDARKVCQLSYPNGSAMSVAEAKRNGLYVNGKPLTDDLYEALHAKASNGDARDKAIFQMARWNLSMIGVESVMYTKSDVEGNVQVKVNGPAHIVGDFNVMVPISGIGDVLIEKLSR